MFRKKISRRKSKKMFSRSAKKVNSRNLGTAMRGGRRI